MKKKKKILIFMFLFSLISFGLIFFCDKEDYENSNVDAATTIAAENEYDYYSCIYYTYSGIESYDDVNAAIKDLESYLASYDVSVYFEDPVTGFSYSYNEDDIYYAASTIKLVAALYLYNMAENGSVNLDDTLVYTSSYKYDSSIDMEKYSYGTSVSIRNLVKYAVEDSDNSAYRMLLDYIGFDNLKAYGNSLGAQYTLVGGDNYGEITGNDAIAYLNELYDYFETETTLAVELQSYFIVADENYLDFSDAQAASKYGEYSEFHNELGIVYIDNPYLISILTREGDNEELNETINAKVRNIIELFYAHRNSICRASMYD
ncbi:MAG TPA: class A beta-lactamase-related serine hydrolase [Bacilli bacterium]|nr:class A beta-lactamase-related serine hydrolase [Bacilli bacterium]